MNLQAGVLILYSAFFIGFGLYIGRRVKKADDFLVAGRSLGPGLLSATFLAANIGAGSTVGATGLGYMYGFGAWWWVGSAGIGSFILANTVGPKIWRLAEKHGWRTVGDFLDYRYNRSVRGLIAVLLWVGTLMILAGQLIAISQILEVVAGLAEVAGLHDRRSGRDRLFRRRRLAEFRLGQPDSANGQIRRFPFSGAVRHRRSWRMARPCSPPSKPLRRSARAASSAMSRF